MASQRATKKKIRREAVRRAAHVSEPTALGAVELRKVRVPCPACAHPSMKRRYLPALGGASGVASCPSCRVELPYEQVLASIMGEPVRSENLPQRRTVVIAPKSPGRVARELLTLAVIVLRRLLGLQRRWSFATVRA